MGPGGGAVSDEYYIPKECEDCDEFNTCLQLTNDGGKTILCQQGCNDYEKAFRKGVFLKCKTNGGGQGGNDPSVNGNEASCLPTAPRAGMTPRRAWYAVVAATWAALALGAGFILWSFIRMVG